ncbi:hypothetical protein ACWDBF_04700 [Streptomyces angustmyceticus]|uniref:hypothetical protein n=1 Tax=Streptomyces angustmyceticus TaxID=285578 RepID=UPI0021AFA4F6|nr:hypothetical protein [Streptomyces angustmyceticus]
MAKMAFTVLWAGVVIVADRVLDGAIWAQYLAMLLLAGIFAFTVDKVPGPRGKGTRGNWEV